MKKIIFILCICNVLGNTLFAAQGFQGIEISTGVATSKYRTPGNEVFNSGVNQNYSTLESNDKKTGSKLGVSYGVGSKNFVTTFGVDYVKTSANMTNGISSGAYGPITQVLQNRYEAYVAPGYRLGYSTLAFIKIGVMDIPTKAPIDTSGVQTLSGGPNSVGLLYGAGITQKLSPNSPYFLKLEYTGGQTKNAYTVDANLNQYLSKIMYGSASASLGFSF